MTDSTKPRAGGRANRTRGALIAAGRRLFAEHAFDAVAIDDIVRAADVAKGSFYNHFEDKDALLRAITGEIRSVVERTIEAANARVDDPARRVARAVCVYLRYAVDEPQRASVIVRVHGGAAFTEAPLNRGLVEDVTEGLAAGRFTLSTMEAGVLFIMGVSQISLVRLTQEPTMWIAVPMAQQMCALLLRGLGVPAPEADQIAAQAADEIVRAGAFRASQSAT